MSFLVKYLYSWLYALLLCFLCWLQPFDFMLCVLDQKVLHFAPHGQTKLGLSRERAASSAVSRKGLPRHGHHYQPVEVWFLLDVFTRSPHGRPALVRLFCLPQHAKPAPPSSSGSCCPRASLCARHMPLCPCTHISSTEYQKLLAGLT